MTIKAFLPVLAFASCTLWAQSSVAFAQSTPPRATQQTFDSPQSAAQALIDAASKNDSAALRSILGSSAKGILTSGDSAQDAAERQEFSKIANQKHNLVPSSMNKHVMVLLIGDQEWPFPIPLRHENDRWRFDAASGAIEVHAREIGANELDAIQACAAFVGVEQEYAMRKRSPAGTPEYAEMVAATPVPKEFAEAAGPNPAHPYHGYYFRVLKEQGPNAPGGQHPYVIGKTPGKTTPQGGGQGVPQGGGQGVMIGGFALVAWPATYNVTGIHTFIVNQNAVVYEKDRGASSATPVTSYDPDSSWMPVD